MLRQLRNRGYAGLFAMIGQLGDTFHHLGPDDLAKFWRQEYEAHKELGKVFKK